MGGFLGAALSKSLAPEYQVVGLYRDSHPEENTTCLVYGDVCDYERVLEVIVSREIDYVYHCAARSIVRNCTQDPLGCFRTNVIGTATVLEASRQSDRVLGVMCMESDKAYGSGPIPYRESQQLQPKGIYEASKSCVSHLVTSYYHNYGLRVFGVRSANVYGPGDPNMTRLIPRTITRLTQGKRPQVTADALEFVRDFLYVDDYVGYIIGLMSADPWGKSVNVGSGMVYRVGDVLSKICHLMDKPDEIDVWKKPLLLQEIPEQQLDLTRLHSYFTSYRPTTDLQQGLQKTIEWYS